ncbi:MAG TPA: hypothetical protein VMU34_05440 [Mycobacterium sp.]|nr:hypothetical protein [Mycobacterium sp.]
MAETPHGDRSTRQLIAGGAPVAAAAFLLVSAVVTVIEGISALANDQMVVVGPDYVYRFSGTAWGCVHIILGVLVGAVALGLFWRAAWAKVAAIVIASLTVVLVAAAFTGLVAPANGLVASAKQ